MVSVRKQPEVPKAILFDLDGTLIDSAPDLALASNILLAEFGHSKLSVDQVRSMIGNGLAKLVERAFAAKGEKLDAATLKDRTDQMMVIYSRYLILETKLFSGAREILNFCKDNEILAGVVTNKPEIATRKILNYFGFTDLVNVVVGGDTGPKRKPSPDMLVFALQSLGVDVQDALMVGDSPADIDAANAANMRSIAVRGGYTDVPVEELGAGEVIDDLFQLTHRLQENR